MATAYATCPLCEANCGIAVEHDGKRIEKVRGDGEDWLSRGYICPKAVALEDIHQDPDRIRTPLRRQGDRWVEVGWDEALDETAERLHSIQKSYGKSAVALYIGNPTIHSYSAVLYGVVLLQALGSRNIFSSNSIDALPRLLVSFLAFGSQAVIPVPDLDRTDFLLIMGANPLVSNGSVMTAPDARGRLRGIQARGGRIVVVDPRRSETAEIADAHHFIRPGTDAFLLAALVNTITSERLSKPGRIADFADGLDRIPELLAPFSADRVAPVVGIDASEIRALARGFAGAKSAVCYGRMGTCTQEFGTLATWLCDVLNSITGNLDRPGGSMFASPPVDLGALAARIGQSGSFDRWRSRVRDLPEFNGELPVATLAEEMETPGEGQVRAMITNAGNPVLSNPNGRRIARALEKLDFMVSIDIYKNETTRFANFILPTSFGLEHDHFPLVFHALSVRNGAKFSPAVIEKPPGVRHDWRILSGISRRLVAKRGIRGKTRALTLGAVERLGPNGLVGLALRLAEKRNGRGRLTLDELRNSPHGIDLGPLEPRLPGILRTPKKRIQLAPKPIVADLERLGSRLDELVESHVNGDSLTLISRRQLRSNNSWMHNSLRLVRGKPSCTLLIHPDDANRRGIGAGQTVTVSSRVGAIDALAEISDEMMPGVVCLPHGWGHDHDGSELSVAKRHAGVSINDLTDDQLVDRASGCASLGVAVSVLPKLSASAV